jgi:pimeloyl-ACP methyl ester carboxylesterase
MHLITANGIRQHYAPMGPVDDPEAPLVVLVHGILIDSLASYFFTLGKPFADAGVATLMYDLRGHGKTDKPATGYTLDDYAADLIALLDTLEITRAVYLLGNSFGGSLALFVAARHPERVAGVVMIEAEAPIEEWGTKLRDIFAATSEHLAKREVMAYLTVRHGRHLAKQAKAALNTLRTTRIEQEMPHGQLLTVEELARVSVPVLGIYAGDSIIQFEEQNLTSWLSRCTTTIIPNQGHSILVEIPGKVCELVLPWIAEHHSRDDFPTVAHAAGDA